MNDVYNTLKIIHHKQEIDRIRKGNLINPVSLQLDITNKCNMNCHYCTFRFDGNTRSKFNITDELPLDVIEDLLSQMRQFNVKAITLTGGGEPLCHPNIIEVLRSITKNKFEFSLVTNGVLLKPEYFRYLRKSQWIRISLDTLNPKIYAQIRKCPEGTINIVRDNIRNLCLNCNESYIGVSIVLTSKNWRNLYSDIEEIRDLGVSNVRIRIANIPSEIQYYYKNKLRIDKEILRTYKLREEGKFDIYVLLDNLVLQSRNTLQQGKNRYRRCGFQHFVVAVGADGKVYPCCVRKYTPNSSFGNIKLNKFKDIWFGRQRRCWLGPSSLGTKCKINHYCRMDQINCNFLYLFEKNTLHKNFI